jgi:Holliday junction resolvasome RuvABC endonuclease subunit
VTRVLGLDLSLTATGYAVDEETVGVLRSKARGPRRLAEIRNFILELASDSEIVVLEGYSYASQNQAHQVGELGGVIRLGLYSTHVPYAEVAPAAVKKFATGKGNADKDRVLAAAIRRFAFEGDDNNAADAWILRAMGLVHYDAVPISLPAGALDAMAKVQWPVLEEVMSEQT